MAGSADNTALKTITLDGLTLRSVIPLREKNVQACPHSKAASCADCRLSELCLPIAMNKSEIQRLDEIIQRNRPLKKGDFLYRQNDPFKSVFAVRSGSLKTSHLSADGQGRVTGFFLPGEILGMDGIASKLHANSAIALEHTSVCEIPFANMEKLSAQIPSLQHHFFTILGKEIAKDQQIHTLLSSYSAEQRIASFFLGLSSRYARVALSPDRFLLHMTRGDIGEYLGLTLETVSRILSGLQKKGIVTIDNKDVTLLDHGALRAIVAC